MSAGVDRATRPSDAAPQVAAADALLARALGDGRVRWPRDRDGQWTRLVWTRAEYHGVCSLLHMRGSALVDWPRSLLDSFAQRAMAASMWELRHRLVLANALEALAAAGVHSVLLKGSALAYSLYPNPATRERGDSDLLIHPEDRAAASAILCAQGFVDLPSEGLDGGFAFQQSWVLDHEDRTSHSIDLHFQPLNSVALARRLTNDDAFAAAMPMPLLCTAARRPSLGFLLVHACLHRAGHRTAPYFIGSHAYYGGDRLIWLKDIDLIVRAMKPADWNEAERLAIASGEAAAVADGIEDARLILGTPVRRGRTAAMRGLVAGRGYYAKSAAERAIEDLSAVRGFDERLRFLAARLFPSRAFLEIKYADAESKPTAVLLVRRIVDLIRRRRS